MLREKQYFIGMKDNKNNKYEQLTLWPFLGRRDTVFSTKFRLNILTNVISPIILRDSYNHGP